MNATRTRIYTHARMFSEVGHDVNASRKTSNALTFLSFIFGLAFLNFFFVFRVMKHRYLVIWSHIVSWRLLLLTRLKFAISSFSSLFICPTGLLIAFVFCCLLEMQLTPMKSGDSGRDFENSTWTSLALFLWRSLCPFLSCSKTL